MSATPDRNRLQTALAEADLRVLLMVMFQISGEERWLQEPYRARRDVKLIADEDAGFAPELQAEIRAAALQILTDQAHSPAHPIPDEALLERMMSKIVNGADLLLHDALSLPTTTALSKALGAVGQSRQSKIVSDVQDYHASAQSLVELGKKSDVAMVAFYHLVPVPPNALLADIFLRGAPDNFLLTEDLMWFDFPVNSDEIIINRP